MGRPRLGACILFTWAKAVLPARGGSGVVPAAGSEFVATGPATSASADPLIGGSGAAHAAEGSISDRGRAEPAEAARLLSDPSLAVEGMHVAAAQRADEPGRVAVSPLYDVPKLMGQLYEAKACTAMHKDCRQTRSCCDAAAACYEKDSGWAECRETCRTGVHLEDRKFTSRLTPWACRQLDAAVNDWEVEWSGGAKIFSRKTTDSEELGFKPRGAILRGKQEGDWIVLHGEPGYALLWNGDIWLLRKVPVVSDGAASTTSSTASTTTTSFTLPRAALVAINKATKELLTAPVRTIEPASTKRDSSGPPAEGDDNSAAGPPVSMFAFKKYLFTAYDSPESAFAALGSGDDLGPLTLDRFVRGINMLKLPLTHEQAVYVFEALNANHDDELAVTEFTSGLQSEHFSTRKWSPSEVSVEETKSPSHSNAPQQPAAATVFVDQVYDAADLVPVTQGASHDNHDDAGGELAGIGSVFERHAADPQAGVAHALAAGAGSNESLKYLRRMPLDSKRTIPALTHSVVGFLSKVPVVVFVNGILSCFMVPGVLYVGYKVWQVAQEKSRRRRPYSVLGERRAFVAEVPPSENRFVARRRQNPTSSQMSFTDSGHFGYELHPGVPDAGAETPVRQVRLSPREMFRGTPSASTPGSSVASPFGAEKKRRVISL